jgi:hypothetical protein
VAALHSCLAGQSFGLVNLSRVTRDVLLQLERQADRTSSTLSAVSAARVARSHELEVALSDFARSFMPRSRRFL